MKLVDGEWERIGYPKRGAERVETELFVINGLVERIETTRYYRNGTTTRFVKKRD